MKREERKGNLKSELCAAPAHPSLEIIGVREGWGWGVEGGWSSIVFDQCTTKSARVQNKLMLLVAG